MAWNRSVVFFFSLIWLHFICCSSPLNTLNDAHVLHPSQRVCKQRRPARYWLLFIIIFGVKKKKIITTRQKNLKKYFSSALIWIHCQMKWGSKCCGYGSHDCPSQCQYRSCKDAVTLKYRSRSSMTVSISVDQSERRSQQRAENTCVWSESCLSLGSPHFPGLCQCCCSTPCQNSLLYICLSGASLRFVQFHR